MDTEETPQLEFHEWLGDQMDRVGKPDQTDFAALVGVAQSSISDWLRGQGLPRKDSREKLARALRIPVSEVDRAVEASRRSEVHPAHLTPTMRSRSTMRAGLESGIRPVDVVYLPVVGTVAADSLRSFWGEGDLYPIARSQVQGMHDPVLFVVSGDCMEPRINDGDLVVLDRLSEPAEGDVVAVRIGDDITLKEYRDEGDDVVLRAIKPGYAPIRIKKSDQGASLVGVARAWFRSGKV